METIRIELLGGLRVRCGSQVLARFRTQKTASLLAYLAYNPGPQPREVLAEMLWPEAEPNAARHSLRTALSSLRRQIEALAPQGQAAPNALFEASHASIALGAEAASVDVSEFRHALGQARRATDAQERARWSERAVELHHAPLLPGFYEDWAIAAEASLRAEYFGALRTALQHLELQCDWPRALEFARRGVALDALNLEAQRDVMRLLALSGAPSEAARHFDALQALLSRHDMALDAPTRALARDIASGAVVPNARPAMIDLARPTRLEAAPREEPHREFEPLPRLFNRFFGREAEASCLRELLESERLVTISGAGGSGKTRLALEVAARLIRERAEPWRGAICFVPLADIADARLIPDAILSALRASRLAHISPLEQAAWELSQPSNRAILLLLDNFEHLVEEGAQTVQVLVERVPGLQVLVTSRRPLGLRAEHEMPLAPLPVAPRDTPRDTPAHQDETSQASVALFVDRARGALPGFAFSPRNAWAISDLCRALEGVPLAIELAAARAGSLSPARMLELLQPDLSSSGALGFEPGFEKFDILRARQRDAPERHRTLRAALDWSFDLLDASLQPFFAALWVFRGGWTPEAARAVCWQGDDKSDEDAARLLELLRECSLLWVEAGADGEPRFRMLETVRQYALERARASGEAEVHRQSHCKYFVELANTASDHFLSSDAAKRMLWVERLRPEHDNLRVALAWSLEHDAVAALRLACALEDFCGAQLTQSELEAERALEKATDAPAHLVAGALGVASIHAAHRGDFARQSELARRRWKLARGLGDEREKAWALFHRGSAARSMGRYARARAHFRRSLAIFHALGDWRYIGSTLNEIGNVALDANDLEAARAAYKECERAFRRCGDRDSEASALAQQGEVALLQDDLSRAGRLFERVRAIERELGDERDHPWRRHQEGKLATARGDFEAAESLLRRSLGAFEKSGHTPGLLQSLLALGCLAAASGDAPLAALLLSAHTAGRESLRLPPPLHWQAARDQALAQARAALGEAEFDAQCEEGAALTLPQAVEQALRTQPNATKP